MTLEFLTFRWPCIVINSYNETDALISQIYFWNKTLHVPDSSSVQHQGFFAVLTAMVYVIQVCWHLPLLCVQWKTPDGGQRNCPKHVEFYSKNKFEKLVQLVGFVIRLEFSRQNFEKNPGISNFMKTCPAGAELFHTNRRADRRKDKQIDMNLIVISRKFFKR